MGPFVKISSNFLVMLSFAAGFSGCEMRKARTIPVNEKQPTNPSLPPSGSGGLGGSGFGGNDVPFPIDDSDQGGNGSSQGTNPDTGNPPSTGNGSGNNLPPNPGDQGGGGIVPDTPNVGDENPPVDGQTPPSTPTPDQNTTPPLGQDNPDSNNAVGEVQLKIDVRFGDR